MAKQRKAPPTQSSIDLRCGDSLDVLRTLADNSIDSCVTDPPYGISFMGKKWDHDVPSVELWAEVFRVLKPGGYLLVFAGIRTQHRMACAIEDAGFEIRDMIAWVYGQGFPKSLSVSKAIDATILHGGSGSQQLRARDGREVGTVGTNMDTHRSGANDVGKGAAPIATPEAQQWDGWGTALKPALEPITMARKPLIGTVAANVLAHGTGAINVDGCRVGTGDKLGGGAEQADTVCSTNHEGWDRPWKHDDGARAAHAERVRGNVAKAETLGRWPANLIHDGSPEVLAAFPTTTSNWRESKGNGKGAGIFGVSGGNTQGQCDSGSAARFFYTAKSSRAERESGLDGMAQRKRDETRNDGDPGGDNPRNRGAQQRANHHPTVKPLALMRYLVKLVTRKGGVCLDPFMGSGTTGWAARLEGCNFIGIDRDAGYVEIARARIAGHAPLFDNAEAGEAPTVSVKRGKAPPNPEQGSLW